MAGPDFQSLCDDLEAEHTALDAVVADLDDIEWETPTPASGWDIHDQVSHLAFFDEKATFAVTEPEAFRAETKELLEDLETFVGMDVDTGRAKSHTEVLAWWRAARARSVEAFRRLDAKTRIDWYGPPMSATSFVTARVMETWAHGQDIVDAISAERDATDRLRHTAHIGVTARGWSYSVRGLTPPASPVRVELSAPSGAMWTWGDAEAPDVVRGPALDFALVVTQRRHVDNTELATTGALAREWMENAQAFAGPPGPGRKPDQF